ncbi:MAG: DUF1997 domain-containing protein [Chlorobiaceae bacterium]|nr:DUF1997 domain-containing protein [Chlorobiaceae bacterium]
MEMDATGISKGDWIFYGEFDRTTAYLSDQKKILGFNPFCYKVEETETENVFRWHFRVTDPQNNPFDVIFYVEQKDELLVELPDDIDGSDPDKLTDEIIARYTVGKKVRWQHYPLEKPIEDPINYLFEGKAFGELDMQRMDENKTRVKFDLKIDVRFMLYPAFRIIPEKIIRAMTNAGMSMIMQTATNRMFNTISKDFDKIQHA